jgi:uncharacterized protein involved in exopolysaccharide biosynthesis
MKSEAVVVESAVQKMLNDSAQDMRLLDFLTVLSKRRMFILGFTVAAAVLTAIVVLLLPSEYTASTLVLPPTQNSSSSSALLGQLASSGGLASMAGSSLGIKSPGEMYVSLFRSRTVESAVVQRFGLSARYHTRKPSEALKVFEGNSTVQLGAKDGLIRISVTDRDAKASSQIANGYVEEFQKLSANLAITEASQRRIFFQQQLLEAKENLTSAEEAMKQTEQSTGVLQIDSQSRALIESAAQLRAQVVAKEVQLQAMHLYATDQNPNAIMAAQQLAALKAQLARLAGTGEDSSSDILVPKGKVPQAGMEYIRKLRDVRYYETISELVAKQFEIAKLDEARQGAIVQVVDPAVPPDTRSFPKRTLTVLLVAFLSFLAACTWSIFFRR